MTHKNMQIGRSKFTKVVLYTKQCVSPCGESTNCSDCTGMTAAQFCQSCDQVFRMNSCFLSFFLFLLPSFFLSFHVWLPACIPQSPFFFPYFIIPKSLIAFGRLPPSPHTTCLFLCVSFTHMYHLYLCIVSSYLSVLQ